MGARSRYGAESLGLGLAWLVGIRGVKEGGRKGGRKEGRKEGREEGRDWNEREIFFRQWV